ncbi:MAG TPA: hypothetical protein VGO03_12380 [Acidimicrobiia bacterium]
MPGVVDPSPMIEEELRVLAAEYEPQLEALESAVRDATAESKQSAKAELRAVQGAYAAARRNTEWLRGPIAKW